MAYVTTWEPNAIALKHNGVAIFHVYKDDEEEQGPRTYQFGLDAYGSDEGSSDGHIVFDIRDLSSYSPDLDAGTILCNAIDNGEITQDNVIRVSK